MQVCNHITLIGNVGQTPTVKTLQSGTRVIEFPLATNDHYRNREGEKVQRTEWHKIKAYGKVVDTLEQYVDKGSKLAVTGSLRYNKWTDSNNQARVVAEIMLDGFQFLGSRSRQQNGSDYQQAEPAGMAVSEPGAEPAKTKKRRVRKSTKKQAVTPVEDLPF
jgi:single-strand DNA-binding protein